MSTKVTMLTIVAALALTVGVGSAQIVPVVPPPAYTSVNPLNAIPFIQANTYDYDDATSRSQAGVSLRNRFNIGGATYDRAVVNSNGALILGPAGNDSTYSLSLGEIAGYDTPLILGFFDDQDSGNGQNPPPTPLDPSNTFTNFGTGLTQYAPAGPQYDSFGLFADRVEAYSWPVFGATNTYAVVLVERNDVAAGDFDIVFDYGNLQWDNDAVMAISDGQGTGFYHPLSDTGTLGAVLQNNAFVIEVRDGEFFTPFIDNTGALLVGAPALEMVGPRQNYTGLDLSAGTHGAPVWLVMSNLRGSNFTGANLAGADARFANFSGGNLTGANLLGVDADDAIFDRANLTDADLSFAAAQDASFVQANVNRAFFVLTDLWGADFTNARNVGTADFTDADVRYADFTGTNIGWGQLAVTDSHFFQNSLQGITLVGTDMSAATTGAGALAGGYNLQDASLTNVNLAGQDMTGGVNLQNATIAGSNLTGVDMTGGDLWGITLVNNSMGTDPANPSYTNFTGTDIRWADLLESRMTLGQIQTTASWNAATMNGVDMPNGIVLTGLDLSAPAPLPMDFTGASFTNAVFSSNLATPAITNMSGVIFDGAAFNSVRFEDVIAIGADFQNADINTVAFRGSDLTGALFGNADIADSDFRNTDLTIAQFQGADIVTSNFDDAIMLGADLSGSTITETKMRDVLLDGADFDGAQLTQVELQGSSLWMASANGAVFDVVDLNGTDLTGIVANGVTILGSEGKGALFDGAAMNGSLIRRTDFRGASFVGAGLNATTMDATNLQGADFTAAQIWAADLTTSGMNLDQLVSTFNWTAVPVFLAPDLGGVQLPTGLDFRQQPGTFADAILDGTVFNGATFDATDDAYFNNAWVNDADFSGTNFTAPQLLQTVSYANQDISGMTMAETMDFNGVDLRNTLLGGVYFDSTNVDYNGASLVGANMDGTTDIAGANFNGTGLTVAQLAATGTWNQPTPMVLGDPNFYQPGFDPRGLGAILGAPALFAAASLNGITLEQGMDLSSGIVPGPASPLLDFRGTDFNGAILDDVDLTLAFYDRNTVLTEANTTVVVTDDLFNWGVADARSILDIKDSLTLADGPTGWVGSLILSGGTLAVDPGDVIVTSPSDQGRTPNGIEIEQAKESTIEVSRDSNMEIVVQMDNPIYLGGPSVVIPGPAPIVMTTELNIVAPNANDWGVLSLNGDVTFEGLLNITDNARVQLMGDYIPVVADPFSILPVEASLFVDNGGVLMGTGRISMDGLSPWGGVSFVAVEDGGTFAPGMVVTDGPGAQDAPNYTIGGKMTVDNVVLFAENSTFRVMIADRNDANGVGVSSGMIVNNDVNFIAGQFNNGPELEVMVETGRNNPPAGFGSGYITEERNYLVLETLGDDPNNPGFQYSIIGQPIWDPQVLNPAMLDLTVVMVDDSLDTLFDQMWLNVLPNGRKFSDFAMNHNSRTIANALEQVDLSALPANEQADAELLLEQLQWESADTLGREIQLLAGVEGPNNMMATLQSIRGVTDRTNDYLYQLRRAARKNNAAGTETVAVDEAADADAAAALQAMSYDWHMRADAIGIWGNVDRDGSSGSFGYSYDSYGFNLAIERMFAPNLIAGMTLAGFTTDLDGDNGSGDADSDTLFMDLHATYTMGDFYVNAALGYAHSWIDSHRHVIGGRRPQGSTESNYYAAGLELGYNFDFEAVNVEPYLRMDYAHARTDGFNDHNGGAANTQWSAWTHNSFRTSLGARVEVPFSVASMPARVRADLAWEHEFADTQADASGRFLAVPINVRSADLGNDALRMGMEMEVDITENISLSGGYQFRGNHDWDQHMANLTLKCAW